MNDGALHFRNVITWMARVCESLQQFMILVVVTFCYLFQVRCIGDLIKQQWEGQTLLSLRMGLTSRERMCVTSPIVFPFRDGGAPFHSHFPVENIKQQNEKL